MLPLVKYKDTVLVSLCAFLFSCLICMSPVRNGAISVGVFMIPVVLLLLVSKLFSVFCELYYCFCSYSYHSVASFVTRDCLYRL